MDKKIESMTDHELLCELVRQGRRAERENQIKTCLIAVLLLAVLILALIYIPRILAPIRQLNAALDEVQQTIDQAKGVLGSFNAESVEKFQQTMDSVNTASQQATEIMTRLKDSGLDKLQESIEAFNETMERLSLLFRR